ncbi:MAG: hypothetical protein JO029_01120 [Candidatus Eremiobacteraeota bacterium]|nr:hypothetical protein [Candidatus Eremiobacteraeota bacterium]
MRRHARFAQLAPAIDGDRFQRLVRAEHLAAARLDTGFSARIDNYGCLDLTFENRGEIAVVPYLIVQGLMLFLREANPFVWPSWLPPMRAQTAREIEAAVEPWMRSLAIARFVNGEIVKFFDGAGDELRDLFARARSFGFLGAAPTEDVLVRNAPYVYAQRFASRKRVAIVDRDGAGGAALLTRIAGVDVDLRDAERAAIAARWFGNDAFGRALTSGQYDVAIGPREAIPEATVRIALDEPHDGERLVRAAQPIPLSVMVTFDVADGDEVRRFAVSAPHLVLRKGGAPPTAVVGGSSGRIGLVVRDDYLGTGDADADAALALATQLCAQGFGANVVGASHVDPGAYDLLHVFGYRCAHVLSGSFARAGSAAKVPVVVSPYLDDPKSEAQWGSAVGRESLVNAADEALRAIYAGAIAERRLSARTAPEIGASPAADAVVRQLLLSAGALIAAGGDEETRLRELGFGGPIRTVPGVLADELDAEPSIGSIVGLEDFVLVHAPLEARCNQYHIVRSCAKFGYPVVLLGSVLDTEYYGEVVAAMDAGGLWLPTAEVTAAEVAALYRRARVFADASWTSAGLYRMLRAATAGAAIVAPSSGSARSVWPGLAQIVDPASPASIEQGIKAAWERAPELAPATSARTIERHRPFDMMVATLDAYRLAAGVAGAPAPS